MTQRIEKLLRSLAGVRDVRVITRSGALRSVHILRDVHTTPHSIIRNVIAALHAAVGTEISPSQIQVHDRAETLEAIEVAVDVLEDDDEPRSERVARDARANGSAPRPKPDAPRPARERRRGRIEEIQQRARDVPVREPTRRPIRFETVEDDQRLELKAYPIHEDILAAATEIVREERQRTEVDGMALERVDIHRRGAIIRCRSVIQVNGVHYTAIAEAPDGATAEAELAAKVAVDALRAGGLTTATLDGVGFITVGRSSYCIATVRESGADAPRAGTAPLIESMAASATAAVLNALGNFTDARARERARAGNFNFER